MVPLAIEIHGFKGYLRCRMNTIRQLIDVKCVKDRQVKDDS